MDNFNSNAKYTFFVMLYICCGFIPLSNACFSFSKFLKGEQTESYYAIHSAKAN